MVNMKRTKTLLLSLSLFTLLLQGCGEGSKSETTTPTAVNGVSHITALGESASVVSNDPSAKMAPSEQALKAISQEIAKNLKIEITELNNLEEITLTEEINDCSLSGLKVSTKSNSIQNTTDTIDYQVCKESETTKKGKAKLIYHATNSDGKFPKALNLTILEVLTSNHLTLNKDVEVIVSDILYNNNTLKTLTLNITGTVHYYTQEIKLNNYRITINF